MDFNQFAETIKQKYPQYKDRDNKALAEAMVAKFPQYKDRVSFEPVQQEKSALSGAISNLTGGVPLPGKEQKGLPQGLKELTKQAAQQIGAGIISPVPGSFVSTPVRVLQEQSGQVGKTVEEKTGSALAGFGASVVTDPTTYFGGGMAAKGVAKGISKGVAKAGQVVDELAQKGAVELLGIDKALPKLQKMGENPSSTISRVINHFKEDKILSDTPAATWEKFNSTVKEVGKKIEGIYNKIGGEKAVVGNAEEALKPLFEELQDKAGKILSRSKDLGKDFEETYTWFVRRAEESGGKISLSDVRKAMDEVGKSLSRVAKDSTEHASLSQLYGKLANIRDNVVEQTANTLKDKGLKETLLKFNEKYSTYLRLSKDITKETFNEMTKLSGPKEALLKYLGRKALITKAEKGFPVTEQGKNKAVLNDLLTKLKSEKGEITLGRDTLGKNAKGFQGKPFSEQKFPLSQKVKVTMPDGDTFIDEVKGLNKGHALSRAKENWPGAKISAIETDPSKMKAPLMEEKGLINPPTLDELKAQLGPRAAKMIMKNRPDVKPYIIGYSKDIHGNKIPLWNVKGKGKEIAKLGYGEDPASIPEHILKEHGLL